METDEILNPGCWEGLLAALLEVNHELVWVEVAGRGSRIPRTGPQGWAGALAETLPTPSDQGLGGGSGGRSHLPVSENRAIKVPRW